MRELFKRYILWTLAVVLAVMTISGCEKDDDVILPEEVLSGISFGYDLEAFGSPETRSLLSASDIEDRITGITVFVYKDAKLEAARHFTSDFSSMTFDLKEGETYDVYALANMGDQSSLMPADKSSVSVGSVVYEVPSYSFVNTNGIPMAGMIEDFKVGSSSSVISLKRLFSKVTAKLSVDFDGAVITSAKVKNLNGTLFPFGRSAAESSSSVMSDVEVDLGSAGSYVFYVPENLQGTLGSATVPHFKNPDLDSDIAARKDVLTYLEVEVSLAGSQDYSGSLVYRSYLGNSNTKNFDLMRNCRYVWEVVYHEDNLQYNDWKVDTGDLTDNRIMSFKVDPVYAEAGQTVEFADVISSSLSWDAVAHEFADDTKGLLQSYGTESLVVKSGASDGSTLKWSIAPKSNPSTVGDEATLQVVTRYIDVIEDSYSVDPGSSVVADVDYGDTGRGRIYGKGASLWSHTVSAGLGSAYSSSDDKVIVSVPSTMIPGSYSLDVKTSDSRFSDAAVIEVNDTRYIDLLGSGSPAGTVSSDGDRLDVGAEVGTFTGSQTWTIPFDYGDVTGRYKVYGKDVADHSSVFDVDFSDTWLTKVSIDKGKLVMMPKSGIPMGSYPVVLSYADNGKAPVTAYLNITGKLVQGITLSPSPMIVWIGEPASLTATVSPADATIKTVTWSVDSGSEYASVDASGVVSGIAPGIASVVATATDGSGVSSPAASVEVRQHVTSVNLSKSSVTILVGDDESLVASVAPDNAYDRSVTWSSSDPTVAAVDQTGHVTALKAGTCKVTAVSNDLSTIYGECSVTVKNDITSRLVLDPSTFDLNVGAEAVVSARYYTTTNGVEDSGIDVTSLASWTVDNSSMASVSFGKVRGKAAGTVKVTASYGDVSATAIATVKDVVTHRISLSPADANVSVGSTVQLRAMYYTTTNGVENSGVDITNSASWSSGNESCATVSSTGLVSGKSSGEAVISVSYKGTTGSTSVFVGDVVTYKLAVSPSSQTVNVGSAANYTATYYVVTNGVSDSGTDVTSSAEWSSSNTSVAVVNKGKVTVSASGGTTIKAVYNGVSGSATLTGKDVISYSLEISPSNPYVSVGSTTSVVAKYYTITNGVKNSGQDVTNLCEWSSDNASVATVSYGIVSGESSGTASIKAKYNGETAIVNVSVGDVVTYELEISGGSASVDYGSDVTFKAMYYTVTNGVRDSGKDVTASASWTSNNTTVASVSKGTVTGKNGGNVTITASYGGYSDAVSVKVNNVVTYDLVVSPSSASIDIGEKYPFKATYYTYTNDVQTNSVEVTSNSSCVWKSGSSSVASVSKGVALGLGAGTASISATYGGITASATLKVYKPVVYTYELVVSPSSLSLEVGEEGGLSAEFITYADGDYYSSSTVTAYADWSSSKSSVATVSKGDVSGVGAGTATVTASYSGYSGSATVTVTSVNWTYDLVVDIDRTSFTGGGSANATATYRTFRNGSLYDSYDVTSSASWSSSNTTVATVSKGSVTVYDVDGTSTITATYNGKSDSVGITAEKEDVWTYALSVSPSSLTLGKGDSGSLTATYTTYLNGSYYSSSDVTSSASWSKSGYGISVSGGDVSVSVWDVDGTVTATYNGKSASATIYGKPEPAPVVTYSLEVSPSSVEVKDTGSGYFTATFYTYEDGVEVSSSDVTSSCSWSVTSGSTYVSVSGGTVTGKGGSSNGSATVKASYSYGGKTYTGTGSVSYIAAVVTTELVVSIANTEFVGGGSTSATATYFTYKDGVEASRKDVTSSASWSSSDEDVATVSGGSITVKNVTGSATIKATYSGKSDSGTVSSTEVGPTVEYTYRLLLDAETWSTTVGSLKEFTATYYTYANDVLESSEDVSYDASWSSSNVSVVNGGPELEALGAGSAVVTVSYEGLSATLNVNVADPDTYTYSVYVSPSSSTGYVGESVQLTAYYRTYKNGSLQSSVNVTDEASWSSSKSSVAYHEDGGTHYLVGVGTTTITASYNGKSSTASITVKEEEVQEKTVYIDLGALTSSKTVKWTADETLQCDVSVTLMWSADYDHSVDSITLSKGSSSGTISCGSIPNSLNGKYPDASYIISGGSCTVGNVKYTYVLR